MRLDKNAIGDLKKKSKIDCTDVESMYSQQIGTFKSRSKSQFQKAEQRLERKQLQRLERRYRRAMAEFA